MSCVWFHQPAYICRFRRHKSHVRRFIDYSERLHQKVSGSFRRIEEARTTVVTRRALNMLIRAQWHMQGINGCSLDICRGPTLCAIVTCRGLALLDRSGSWHECDIIGCVILLPRTAPEPSRLVSSRAFSTSQRFASRSLTPDKTSPSALTLLRPKRATKRQIATPTSLLFCAATENSNEMYVGLFAFFVHYLVSL